MTGNAYRAGITTGNWSGEQVDQHRANLARGTWKTLTYTLDDATDTARLYLDGAAGRGEDRRHGQAGRIGGGVTTANYIGRSNYASDRYLPGSVRDFRIYGTALGATEVAAAPARRRRSRRRDADALDPGDLSAVTSNLTLPTTGVNGSTIAWASECARRDLDHGRRHAARRGQSPAAVSLIATITRGAATEIRTVLGDGPPLPADQADVDAAAAALEIAGLDDVRGNLTLPTASNGDDAGLVVVEPGRRLERRSRAAPGIRHDRRAHGDPHEGRRDREPRVHGAGARRRPSSRVRGLRLRLLHRQLPRRREHLLRGERGQQRARLARAQRRTAGAHLAEGTKGLRDPFLIRSPEGDTFYLIATDLSIGSGTSWGDSVRTGSKYLEVWESNDLMTWSPQRHIKVAPETAGKTWAPEAYYDESIGSYVVFWASALYGDDDPGHTGSTYHRMMYATTRDFVTFTPAQVWQDQGMSRIDSTVLKEDGTYYRFTKDEGAGGTGCADIIQEKSTELRATLESWTMVDSCIGPNAGTSAVEGPTAFKANPGDINGEKFYLFVDEYGGRGYIPLETDDIANPDWEVAPNYDLPASPRHGTVIPITAAELESLGSGPAPLRSTRTARSCATTSRMARARSCSDVSGNGQDGTISGGATWGDGSLNLDGSDDYVDLPDNLLAGVTDVTVEADVWIDSAAIGQLLHLRPGQHDGGRRKRLPVHLGQRRYRTSLATGNWTTEQTVSQGSNLPRGQWAHLVYTLKGDTATIYLDGVAVGTGTVTTDPGDIGGGITTANYLGRSNYDADNTFRGKYREFAIYDRALSADEVLRRPRATSARSRGSLSRRPTP